MSTKNSISLLEYALESSTKNLKEQLRQQEIELLQQIDQTSKKTLSSALEEGKMQRTKLELRVVERVKKIVGSMKDDIEE